MGLFDSEFNLPKISDEAAFELKIAELSAPKLSAPIGFGELVTPDNIISYATATTGKLANEAFDAVATTFGGIGDFTKLISNAPTFLAQGAAALGVLRSNLSRGLGNNTLGGLGKASTGGLVVSAAETKAATGRTVNASNTNHKVKLTAPVSASASFEMKSNPAFPFEPLSQSLVEFDVMPEVSENRTAEYEALAIPQAPTEFQRYRGSKATTWAISGTFTARTRTEALRNYIYINTIRGWMMSYFGENQARQFPGLLGAPPPILIFSGWRGLVGPVPVVLTSASWTWPSECDWLPTGIKDKEGQEIPFPSVMHVTINLTESFSPKQVNDFNLQEFRLGNMIGAFDGSKNAIAAPSEAKGTSQARNTMGMTGRPTMANDPRRLDRPPAEATAATTSNLLQANPDSKASKGAIKSLTDSLTGLYSQVTYLENSIDNGQMQFQNSTDAVLKQTIQVTIDGYATELDTIRATISSTQKTIDSLRGSNG